MTAVRKFKTESGWEVFTYDNGVTVNIASFADKGEATAEYERLRDILFSRLYSGG